MLFPLVFLISRSLIFIIIVRSSVKENIFDDFIEKI